MRSAVSKDVPTGVEAWKVRSIAPRRTSVRLPAPTSGATARRSGADAARQRRRTITLMAIASTTPSARCVLMIAACTPWSSATKSRLRGHGHPVTWPKPMNMSIGTCTPTATA